MLNNSKQNKVEEIKGILNEKGIIFNEKANGQLNIDKISYWATSGKWYDPTTGGRGEGINSFLSYLSSKGIRLNGTMPIQAIEEVAFIYETVAEDGTRYKFIEEGESMKMYIGEQYCGYPMGELAIKTLLRDIRKLRGDM